LSLVDVDDRGDPNGTLAEKLRYLRFTHRGLNNQIHSFAQIAQHVTRVTGRRCSEKAIEHLFMPGATTKYPSAERLAAILSLFGKTPRDLEDRGDPSGTLGRRVAYLRYRFAQKHRHGKLPSLEEIARYVRDRTGRSCTASYVSQILCDKAPHGPAMDKIEALAAFFAVSPAFFFPDDLSREMLENERRLCVLQDFVDAFYELLEIRDGVMTTVLRYGKPSEVDEFLRLKEVIRGEIDAVRAERALPAPREHAVPG
jgi:transcriptional regulator with XRE-family HTH domain